MSAAIRLLGLSGSLRQASAHTAVLRSLQAVLPAGVDLQIGSLAEIPLYNQDLDQGPGPAAVAALRTAVAQADGLILGSPEYNYGMSGVLKNALDWLSRPMGASVMMGKPVITFTASPAFTGGVRAQQQLNETLRAMVALQPAGPQNVIGLVHQKISDGQLTDEATLNFLLASVQGLLASIAARRGANGDDGQ